MVCICHIYISFIRSSTMSDVGFFHLLAVADTATTNTGVSQSTFGLTSHISDRPSWGLVRDGLTALVLGEWVGSQVGGEGLALWC